MNAVTLLMAGVLALYGCAFAVAYLVYTLRRPKKDAAPAYTANSETNAILKAPAEEKVIKMFLGGPYLLSAFTEVFKINLLQIHRKDIDGPSGEEEYTMTGQFGGSVRGVLEFSVIREPAVKWQLAHGMTLEDFADENGNVGIVGRVSLSIVNDAEASSLLKTYYETLQENAVQQVASSKPDELRIFELTKDGTDYYFEGDEKPLRYMDTEMVACSYETVKIHYKGQQKTKPLVDLLDIFVEQYLQGKNIVISGPGGSGKTTLMHNILARAMELDRQLRVVKLTHDTMSRLQDPQVRAALMRFAKSGPIAFYYDEAQGSPDYTPLFTLMEGDKIGGAPVIAAVNTSKAKIPIELFRNGRTDIQIETCPLAASTATKLKNLLVKRFPTHRFDVESLRMMLNADNKSWGKSMPCPQGQIMLCDVWSCLHEQVQLDRLEAILNADSTAPAVSAAQAN